jgi:hypothetical protein
MSNPVSAISGGASVLGGISGSKASKSAANAQAQASQQSTEATIAEQRRQYDQNRADLAPGRALYGGASNKLAEYLGIDTGQGQNVTNAQSEYDAAMAALTNAQSSGRSDISPTGYNNSIGGLSPSGWSYPGKYGIATSVYAKNGLPTGSGTNNVDLSQYQQRVDAARNALTSAQNTPTSHSSNFGSLLNPFTQNDLNNDPVYQSGLQFGLDNGNNAIESRARASGSSDSGSVLKELARFGNDYGSTKANDAYNRFNTTKQQNYGFLSGAAGLGSGSTNATVQAGQNASGNISNAILANGSNVGNARSAGIVGSNNAWSNALGGLANQNWFSQQNSRTPSIVDQYNGGYGTPSWMNG